MSAQSKKSEQVVEVTTGRDKNKKTINMANYAGLPSKSAKIRAMDADGFSRSQIAQALGIRYQHVRNVLITPVTTPKGGATETK